MGRKAGLGGLRKLPAGVSRLEKNRLFRTNQYYRFLTHSYYVKNLRTLAKLQKVIMNLHKPLIVNYRVDCCMLYVNMLLFA